MAAHHVHRTQCMGGVQTHVIGHDLMSLGVREYLVTAHAVAVAHANLLAVFTIHCIQARIGVHISYL